MKRRYVTADKVPEHKPTYIYWDCPNKCGRFHFSNIQTIKEEKVSCVCGYTYKVLSSGLHSTQKIRILIEEDINESNN